MVITVEVTSDELVVHSESTRPPQSGNLVSASLAADYDACCADDAGREQLEGEMSDTINAAVPGLSGNATVSIKTPGTRTRARKSADGVEISIVVPTVNDGILVTAVIEDCKLCFVINGDSACASTPDRDCRNLEDIGIAPGGVLPNLPEIEPKLECTEAQVAALGGCFNEGECVLTRDPQACDDDDAPYDIPKCMCKLAIPLLGGAPVCYFGSSCENPVECPSDTQACNYRLKVPNNADPSDAKFGICNTESDTPVRSQKFCTQPPQASAVLNNADDANKTGTTTETALFVLGVVVLLVLVGILIAWRKRKSGLDGGALVVSYQNPLYIAPGAGAPPTQSLYATADGVGAESTTDGFSNPMYAAMQQREQVPESAYADLGPAVAVGNGQQDPAYFDISPNGGKPDPAYFDISPIGGGASAAGNRAAYMDISPNAAAAAAAGNKAAYMDVAPNGGGETWAAEAAPLRGMSVRTADDLDRFRPLTLQGTDFDQALYDNTLPRGSAGYMDIGSADNEPTYDVGSADNEPTYDVGSGTGEPTYDVGSGAGEPLYDVGVPPSGESLYDEAYNHGAEAMYDTAGNSHGEGDAADDTGDFV